MTRRSPVLAIILWIASIVCNRVECFLFVNLKRDPKIFTTSKTSPIDSGRSERKIRRLQALSTLAETETAESEEEDPSRIHRVDFVSPLLDYGYPPAAYDLKLQQDGEIDGKDKPILLYLPGFDGTYICPFIQFPELGTEFEVWCMTIGMEDRSTYEELKTMVLDFVKNDLTIDFKEKSLAAASTSNVTKDAEDVEETSPKKNASSNNSSGLFAGWFGGGAKKPSRKRNSRPIYIAGESFGGILASDIARTLLEEQTNKTNTDEPIVDLQGLVLINPATCYDRSQLATAGPPIAKQSLPLYLLGLVSKLLPLFTDEFSFEQLLLILQAKALPSVIDNPCREAYMGRVALSLPTRLEFMPPSTMDWRLNEWLQTGCSASRDLTFAAFPNFRSLIVVGEKDKTLPSIAEAERLANKVTIPTKTRIHVVEGAGHASTCGSRLDLAAEIRNSFPELQKSRFGRKKGKRSQQDSDNIDLSYDSENENTKRTSMKSEAQEGFGPYFGMTERYDKADIGLNPLKYWSKTNFQAVQKKTKERSIALGESQDPIQYKKTEYSVSS